MQSIGVMFNSVQYGIILLNNNIVVFDYLIHSLYTVIIMSYPALPLVNLNNKESVAVQA